MKARDGWASLVCIVVIIAGAFAFDGGWQLGGAVSMLFGLVFLCAIASVAKDSQS